MKYLNLTIKEINKLLKAKKIKPIDLVNEAIENIEKHKEYNAYITLNKEEAIKKAKELEDKEVDNLFFGLLLLFSYMGLFFFLFYSFFELCS